MSGCRIHSITSQNTSLQLALNLVLGSTAIDNFYAQEKKADDTHYNTKHTEYATQHDHRATDLLSS